MEVHPYAKQKIIRSASSSSEVNVSSVKHSEEEKNEERKEPPEVVESEEMDRHFSGSAFHQVNFAPERDASMMDDSFAKQPGPQGSIDGNRANHSREESKVNHMNVKKQSIMERRKAKVRPISLKRITNNKANDNSALKLQASAGNGQP